MALEAFKALTDKPLPDNIMLIRHGTSKFGGRIHLLEAQNRAIMQVVDRAGIKLLNDQLFIDELGQEGRVFYTGEEGDYPTPQFIPHSEYYKRTK